MINLDQLQNDQNNPLLAADWQKKLPDSANILTVDAANFQQDEARRSSLPKTTEPVTPADADDPVPAPSAQNPSPDTPGDLLSAPNDDNDDNDSAASSLSPAPSARPDPSPADDPHAPAASRQSTPLTELSGPATPPHAKDEESVESKKDMQDGEDPESKSEAAEDPVPEVDKSSAPDVPVAPEPAGDSAVPAPAPAPNGVGSASASPPAAESLHVDHTPAPQKPDLPADEKASAILQLNTELLKVCIECQTRNLMQSPEFNTYAQRLQSNLTWLAAAADRARQTQIPLPIMSPPAAVSFVAPQTINDFYQRLPQLFAKEIAKRQKETAQGVKRGPDSAPDDTLMRKRLDTGERRLSNPPSASASSPPHARSPSVMSNGGAPDMGLAMGMGMGMGMGVGPMTPQQQQPQPAMRVSPESAPPPPPPPQAQPFQQGGPSLSEAQLRERARIMAMRQQQQPPPPPPPPQNMLPAERMPPPNGMGGGSTQMMQAVLSTFGQVGLQNYHALQQGATHPFVNYMGKHVPGFLQLPLQQQLQRMQVVQNNVQQARAAQQAQRAAAAAAVAGMNGGTPQGGADTSSPFARHSGSPPDVGAPHLQGPQMQQMNGMGLAPPQRLAQRAAAPQNMNVANLTPQQRQLLLMQQQMHQRGNDGVMNPQQQAYAAQQAQQQQQQQQGPPPMGTARSPSDGAPMTPRMQQKRPGPQTDPYHMALYNTAQAQRQAGMRPQQGQYGPGTVNPGMMYAGAGAQQAPPPQQNWQSPPPPPQQQFHAMSPAALQHHPDAGTPRPASSASNNAVVPSDTMGDSFESLFNWGGT